MNLWQQFVYVLCMYAHCTTLDPKKLRMLENYVMN